MSLIGTLEQFSLANILQRIEIHEKTGLLVVKQGSCWVEFYFRSGRLLCIGPLRTQATLGERLVNDNLISPQALQELNRTLGNAQQNESRVALALMDLGYIHRDELRAWAIQKATDVLPVVLAWSSGEVYFEEGTPAPGDRLLVSMSVSSLIDSAPQVFQSAQQSQSKSSQPVELVRSAQFNSISSKVISHEVQAPVNRLSVTQIVAAPAITVVPSTPKPDVSNVPTLMGFGQFLGDTASSTSPLADAFLADNLPSTEALLPVFPVHAKSDAIEFSPSPFQDTSHDISFASLFSQETPSAAIPSIQPMRVMNPVPPKRMDTSFMQPEMLLIPGDFSILREQNSYLQITPDQWRLLTCADGQTTLKTACHMLSMSPEIFCQTAGELVAEHLLYVSWPESGQMTEVSPASHEHTTSGLSNGYDHKLVTTGKLEPTLDVQLQFSSSSLPFETESQWGNGGNGATFIPGRGWITSPQPLQPLRVHGQLAHSTVAFMPLTGNTY